MNAASISTGEFARCLNGAEPFDLIDVRTAAEFREVHLQRARNVPLDALRPEEFLRDAAAGRPLYIICRSGSRGRQACEKLAQAGCNAINIEGGTQACIDAGIPVVRGRKSVSLERQVRIAAGALVLAGVGLAHFVDPRFILLSAFVGAGLVFAGITDTCGMGLLLSRMPWNR